MPSSEDPSIQRSHLSQAKQMLLQRWKRGELSMVPDAQGIPRRPEHGVIPLSFAQQRLWFIDQLVPGNPAYNVALSIRLSGSLNVGALEESLNKIVHRHEILRTCFPAVDGKVVQDIAPTVFLPLPRVDLRELPGAERESEAVRLLMAEAGKSFNLAQGPLIRTRLLQLSAETHVFLLMMHHTVCDGWSLGIFLQELKVLYESFLKGNPSPLPELPIQYADFAIWQRHQLQGQVLESQLAYWKKQLENAPTMLPLPTDRPRPSVQTFHGSHISFALSGPLTAALKALSQREETTLFMTLLAAFQLLLARYSGQDDIIVGTPIANRERVEIEGLIGFFATTLVLRTAISDNLRFRELLGRVRETTLGAYAHQNLPFEQLVDELHLERDMSRNPLFQVMFNFGHTLTPVAELSGLKLSLTMINGGTAMFDLWLSMWEEEDALHGVLEYNTDLFDESTISRVQRHFQILLESIVANPMQVLADLPLVTGEERRQQLVEWNATQVEYPQDACLHTLFEAQTERTPDAVALSFEGEQITYRQLNQEANRLARHLQEFSVGPDVLVGICAERSIEMVIGLLGILKAGGAYVPLDPGYPAERLAFMLMDAHLPVVLSQSHLRDRLSGHGVHIICLDESWDQGSSESTPPPPGATLPESLAYVIYTSGSTGKPKGAMNTHRGICNRLLWMQQAYQLNETDRVMQKTPFSFDVSVWEFFWPLLFGARLVVARPEGHRDTVYLRDLIVQQQITTLHFVPSMLRVFLDEQGLEQCTRLRRVICSGEALPFEIQQRFFSRLAVELHNLYGPTEASVDVTSWACERQSARQSVPIGRPIANTQIYLLDQQLNPVPVAVAGELYIGGVGLARGYLHRPELTAERFIPNPFSAEPGSRLYKTGDLARYLPDGNIEYLGRLDDQVKLHGFRIELGEIESTLRRHPDVRDAVAMVVGDTLEDRRLAAYVVPHTRGQNEEELDRGTQLPTDQVEHWREVFDETYRESPLQGESAFNIVGWNSSYTGLPFSEEEMREWVEYTVKRILALHPHRVLEIGCGTGLLLLRVAPHCSLYVGTDISQEALGQLMRSKLELSQVRLLQQAADNFASIEDATLDTVVLNSVIQYFPNVDYLLRVLKGAVNAVRTGGAIFVGDVRSLPLLKAFSTSVEMYQASPSMPTEQLRQRIQKRIAQESELAVDPAFFFALGRQLPQIGYVEVQLKRGRYHNELTRFRYDVILHVGTGTLPVLPSSWFVWQKQGLTLEGIRQILVETEPEALGIRGVPNARLLTEIRAQELLAQDNCPKTVDDLRRLLQELPSDEGVDPEAIWAACGDLAYTIAICPSRLDAVGGSYDVVFRRSTSTSAERSTGEDPSLVTDSGDPRPWSSYTNNPIQNQFAGQMVSAMRSFLKAQLPEYMVPPTIILLDTLPISPNGKLDRRSLPRPEAMGAMSTEAFVAPRTPVEEKLAEIWAQVLGLERVGVNSNFFELGGDSIRSVQIVSRANRAGLHLTPRLLFQHQTIAELAAVTNATLASARHTEQTDATAFPLTPIQRWFFEHTASTPERWARVMLFETQPALDPFLLEQAVHHLLRHHDALRLRFRRGDAGWEQFYADNDESSALTRVALSEMSQAERDQAVRTTIERIGLNPADGPSAHFILFDTGPHQPGLLLLMIHRLVADDLSWQLLLADLQTAYRQLDQGHPIQLPPGTTSFRQWSYNLMAYAQSDAPNQERIYWAEQSERVPRLPSETPGIDVTALSTNAVSVSLDAEETYALQYRVHNAYHTQITDLLLAALLQAFARWSGKHALLVDLEGNGQLEPALNADVSRTVGCFTTLFPVRLDLGAAEGCGPTIRQVKEQLRRIPHQGIGYGALRYLRSGAAMVEQLQSAPQAELLFSYEGDFDRFVVEESFLRGTSMPDGPATRLRTPGNYLLEISSSIIGGQLYLIWTYRADVYHRSTIENLASDYLETLRSLIAHCLTSEVEGYTPSDFSLARLDQQELDLVLSADPSVEDLYPLTPMQQNMLFQRNYTRNAELYWLCAAPLVMRRAHLNVTAYERAWQKLVDQHPAMRTSFVWEGPHEPHQVVHKRVEMPMEQYDLRGLSSNEQEERLEIYIQALRNRGSDLARAPHTHLALFRMSDEDYSLVQGFNYMLQDGWSSTLLLRDVEAFYEAFCQGRELQLEPPRHYRDYMAWLQQQNLSRAEAFWRKTLRGFTATMSLADWHPSEPPRAGEAFTKESLSLSVATTTALQSMARKQQLTMATLLNSAWALILSRQSGLEDVIFGYLCSGRPAGLPGSEYMVGFFNNILPLRVHVPPGARLLPWLLELQAQTAELREYEYSPLLKIKEWVGLSPVSPIFESYLVFENFPMYSYEAMGERARRDFGVQSIDHQRTFVPTEYPIRIEFWPVQPLLLMISGYGRYCDRSTAALWLRQFKTLLEGMVANPMQRLGDLIRSIEAEA